MPQKEPKPAPPVYVYTEFPRMLYKIGAPRPIAVNSAEEEERMTEQGWGRTPVDPPAPRGPMSYAEQIYEDQEAAHRRAINALKEHHADNLALATLDLRDLREKHAALETAHDDLVAKLSGAEIRERAGLHMLAEAAQNAEAMLKEIAALEEINSARRLPLGERKGNK